MRLWIICRQAINTTVDADNDFMNEEAENWFGKSKTKEFNERVGDLMSLLTDNAFMNKEDWCNNSTLHPSVSVHGDSTLTDFTTEEVSSCGIEAVTKSQVRVEV